MMSSHGGGENSRDWKRSRLSAATTTPIETPPLSKILSEDPAYADKRTSDFVDERVPDWTKVALFGAGNIGRMIARRMRCQGVKPLALIDDTASKQGTSLEGIPVVSQYSAAKQFGSNLRETLSC